MHNTLLWKINHCGKQPLHIMLSKVVLLAFLGGGGVRPFSTACMSSQHHRSNTHAFQLVNSTENSVARRDTYYEQKMHTQTLYQTMLILMLDVIAASMCVTYNGTEALFIKKRFDCVVRFFFLKAVFNSIYVLWPCKFTHKHMRPRWFYPASQ